jgi:hypothetical protein
MPNITSNRVKLIVDLPKADALLGSENTAIVQDGNTKQSTIKDFGLYTKTLDYATWVYGASSFLTTKKLNVSANNGTYAASITQSGTGYALIVNDISNDATPFIIDQHGHVGIGLSALRSDINDVSLTIVGDTSSIGDIYNSGNIFNGGNIYAISGSSITWDSVYSTTRTTSADWNSVYSNVNLNSGNFIQAQTFVNNNSSNISQVNTRVNTTSANWNSVYSNVNLNSGNFIQAQTFVNNNSSNISQVNTRVNTTSANWNTAYNNAIYTVNGTAGQIIATSAGNNTGNNSVTLSLPYTPIQQGGGTGQNNNKIFIGWNTTTLGLQVDNTNFSETWPINISGSSGSVTLNSVGPAALTTGAPYWDSTGKVGIGTGLTTLTDVLHVNGKLRMLPGSPTEGGQITLMDGSAYSGGTGAWEIDNANSNLRFFRDKGAANATAMIITTAVNVGIGTFSPAQRLEVYGDGAATSAAIRINNPNTSSSSTSIIYLDANNQSRAQIHGQTNGSSAGGNLIFKTGDSSNINQERVRIDASGNVGIGTNNPQYALDVTGSIRASSNILGTWIGNAIGTAYGGTGATTQQGAINALAGSVTNASYLRGNGSNVVMSAIQASDVPTLNQNTTGSAATLTTTRTLWGQNFNGSANVSGDISSAGNITGTGALSIRGVGPTTRSQGAFLSWNEDGSTGKTYLLNQKGGGTGGFIFGEVATNNTITERVRIDASGNVGIGTNNPQYALDVTGSIRASSNILGTWIGNAIGTAYGGTGATTQQGAINALAGSVTNASYLRGNGSNVVMSAIQASDVPTLNQNTTGSAATLTTTRTLWGQNFNGSANVSGDISSAGNITGTGALSIRGVGPTTRSQGAFLSWNEDGSTGKTYLLNQKGGGTGGFIFGEVATNNTITERVRIDASGNVGIGTNNPAAAKLTVSGTISSSGIIYGNNFRAVQGTPNSLDGSTNGYAFGADGDTGVFSPIVGVGGANGVVSIYANNTENLRATNNCLILNTNVYSVGSIGVGGNFSVSQLINGTTICADATNTCLGNTTLSYNYGVYNTAIGTSALFQNQGGNCNTAVGFSALSNVANGSNNIAVGHFSLYQAEGSNNTAIGVYSGQNMSGDSNTASGAYSLNANTGSGTGAGNSAFGHRTLESITTGSFNTGVGNRALYSITTGGSNVAIGCAALQSTGTGSNNVAIGNNAGRDSTSTSFVVAVGAGALQASNGLNGSVAVGYQALTRNTFTASTSGCWNTAVGMRAMCSNTTGTNNTASGWYALAANSTGYGNIAYGSNSLISNTTGCNNHAIGLNALKFNTTGCNNVGLGTNALCNLTTGSNNIAIGYSAGTDDLNLTANSNITTGSNIIVLGNFSHTASYIKTAWTVTSDARDKTNISCVPQGLNFVSSLNPVSYKFKKSRIEDVPQEGVRTRYGFLAQDILALEGDKPVIIDNSDPEHLMYNESSLIPVLVNAIKELTERVKVLESKI